MGRGIFVTGTDTGVGKTLVTAGIVRWLRNQGIDAAPMKPVQTGGERRGDRLVATDLEFALSAANMQLSDDEIRLMSPYVYEPACSPHLAGKMAGRYVEPSVVKNCADRLLTQHEAIVVEGAGGIEVPLNESDTMLDLMVMLGYPVVLVSRFGLSTSPMPAPTAGTASSIAPPTRSLWSQSLPSVTPVSPVSVASNYARKGRLVCRMSRPSATTNSRKLVRLPALPLAPLEFAAAPKAGKPAKLTLQLVQ